ncbi:hypothetical protein TRFO_34957 [Tritrichomonas foetus]|uniref:Uncharacterized protein n=1 Tax=Tritrichomonas foetus TaxID=1144522 RepID=A0A1J4JJ62_9EUKA|nr:hypothetical protein TRFO_34957 [Tritrichomonas foetus]|eukprot:OHS98625.1 hypothetical protein TRFO_34957 [Tritrichomonas foetus]
MGDFESWDVNDVVNQLKKNGLDDAASCFLKHEIEGCALPIMTDDHLKEIGITKVGPRLHVMKWIKDVTASYHPPSSSTASFSSPQRIREDPYESYSSPKATPKPSTAAAKTRQSTGSTSTSTPTRSSTNSMGSTSKGRSSSKGSRPTTTSSKRIPYANCDPENVPKCKRDHDKMVEQIRAARKYMAYEKALEEGRAVGPPPELPPIEEPPDLVQCPNCGRKFGEEQAKKHIPVCQRMNSGKNRRW